MASNSKQVPKRVKQSKEDKLAKIEQSIEFHKQAIEKLEKKREEILNPKTSPLNMKTLLTKAKKSGMTVEEIAEKLGLQMED